MSTGAASPDPSLDGNVPDSSPVALLLIDVINHLEFEGGDKLVEPGEEAAERIRELAERARRSGVPVIYVNDNYGRWRSDFSATIRRTLEPGTPGRRIAELLRPAEEDYFVLKPKHSGFFSTTLDLLLEHLGARTLILTGMTTDSCVLATAMDAHMREYRIVVPSDCVASPDERLGRQALEQMRLQYHARTQPAGELDLEALTRGEAPC